MTTANSKTDDVVTEQTELAISLKDDLQWVVLCTKSRSEKKVYDYCCGKDLCSYLPLRPSVKTYGRKTVRFMKPLFPGYIFIQMDPNEQHILNGCQHIIHIIRPANDDMEKQLVSDLRGVQIIEKASEKGEIVVRPEIHQGDAVTVRSGTFRGLTGVVSRWRNRARITVNVELVGQSVMIDLDASEVELDF